MGWILTFNGEQGAVLLAGGVDSLLPRVSSGVGEFEAAAHLFEADAASALVGLRLGVVAVGDFAADAVVRLAEADADVAGLGGRDAVLEGVLDERDEDERSYLGAAFGTDVEMGLDGHVGREPDAHQGDVVADEVHLLVQRYEVLLVVVEDVAQQSAQFLHGLLGLVGVEGDEGVDVVERVEQEVGIELAAQVLELGFGALLLGFAAGGFVGGPAAAHADGGTEAHGEYHGEDVAQEENPLGRPVRAFVRPGDVVVGNGKFLPEVRTEGDDQDADDVEHEVGLDVAAEQVARDEQAIVEVEDDEERQGDNTTMAQVAAPRDVESAPAHHEEREAEDDAPADDVGQCFDEIGAL